MMAHDRVERVQMHAACIREEKDEKMMIYYGHNDALCRTMRDSRENLKGHVQRLVARVWDGFHREAATGL